MTTPLKPIAPSLQRTRAQMLDLLAQLDRLGEHVAAAHLAAAIDALEDGLTMSAAACAPRQGKALDGKPFSKAAPLDLMARGLADHLGERASHVARSQMVSATGDVLLAWATIANRIDEIQHAGVPEA